MDIPADSQSDGSQQIRVAIVGTGLAGLTTAYLLHNDPEKRCAVTLFEQGDVLSFDSASVAVKNEKTGVAERIDLPMRAIAGGYYSNLLRMYRHLSIPMHPIRFLFVFARASSRTDNSSSTAGTASQVPGSYFIHASNLHQMFPPWPGTRGVMSHLLEVFYLLVCYFWFSIACFLIQPQEAPRSSSETDESFAEYLERIRLPRRYISHYLIPLMSSVSTCSHEEMLAFPASDVVNYKKLSHWQQHYTVCGGVSQVQLKLADGLEDIRLGSRVIEVVPSRHNSSATIRWQSRTDESAVIKEETFDRVVLAVSPDVAGTIFSPLKPLTSKIPTRQVESSVLSVGETREQSAVSVVEVADEQTACSHHLGDSFPAQTIVFKTLFSDSSSSQTEALHTMPGGVVVSTCPLDSCANSKRSVKTARFTRTLRSTESKALIKGILEASEKSEKKADGDSATWVNGEDNVWLTGGWCWDGMVLLEGCIVSAMRVANDFGVRVPW